MLVIINTKIFFYFYDLWITIFIVLFPFIQLSLINSHLVACFASLRILSATRKNRRYQRIEGKKKKEWKTLKGGISRATTSCAYARHVFARVIRAKHGSREWEEEEEEEEEEDKGEDRVGSRRRAKEKKKEKKIRPRGGNERKTRSSRWIARARNLIRDVTSSLSRKLPPRRRYRLVDKDNEAGQWAAGPRIVLNKSRFSTVGPPIIDVNDDDCLSIPNPWI